MAKYTEEQLNTCSKEMLITLLLSMQDQMEQLNQNFEKLVEQLASANNQRYGRSSEKLSVIDGQLSMDDLIFNEAEALTDTTYVIEPTEEQVLPKRTPRPSGKRESDLKDLPVEVISHVMSEEQLTAIFGPNGWKQLPDEVFKRVKVQPAVYTVEEHHVAVYAGKDNQTIVKAEHPKSLLRNSLVTPSLGASIMNAKYTNGLPLYRISQEFQRNDIHISRQVMANWMIQLADRYLGIVYDRLHEQLLGYHVLQADETPVKVSKDGRPANSQSYMWVYRTGKYYKKTPIILYDYQKTRKADHPERFLKGFEGLVVTDSYSAYGKLDRESEELSFTACWAHARRRYSDALKALPKGKKDAAAKQTVAYEALTRIAAIYHLDNELTELEPEERLLKRKLTIEPLVEAYFAWLKKIKLENALVSGKTLEGINYSLNHEKALRMFLEDGEVPLDNNATEGALRSFCLHKHTWKLIDTIDGAKSSAIIYSIVETAKANHLHPFRYLEYLLEILKEHQDDTDRRFIDDLLPWSPKLPDTCRVK